MSQKYQKKKPNIKNSIQSHQSKYQGNITPEEKLDNLRNSSGQLPKQLKANKIKIDKKDRKTWSDSGVRRGDVFIVERKNYGSEIDTKHGRPAIVVSNDYINTGHRTVEVVYMTSKEVDKIDTHVPIKSYNYNNIDSTVVCEQIDCVDMSRLLFKAGKISDEEMKLIDKAIATAIGLDSTDIVKDKNKEIADKNEIIHSKNESLAEKDRLLQEKDKYISELLTYTEELKKYASDVEEYYTSGKYESDTSIEQDINNFTEQSDMDRHNIHIDGYDSDEDDIDDIIVETQADIEEDNKSDNEIKTELKLYKQLYNELLDKLIKGLPLNINTESTDD